MATKNKEELLEIKKGKTGHGLLIENDGYMSLADSNNKVLRESFDPDNWHVPYPFIVSAVFQKADTKNANGRIYPMNILKREIENYQTRIRERRALGECNHPDSSTIDLGRISHNIVELHWEGKTVVGKLELNLTQGFIKQGICSSLGDTVANLLLNGYKIGVSSRAIGSVEQKMGILYVGDDLELLAWDIVADPSTPGSWIGKDLEELTPYVESKDSKKTLIEDKISKLESILL